MPWDDATKTVVEEDSQEFERYMLHNHQSWCKYAKESRGLPVKNEDIILVRGFVKNSRWTVVAFPGGNTSAHEVTVKGTATSAVAMNISYTSHRAVQGSHFQSRDGPAGRMNTFPQIPVLSKPPPSQVRIASPQPAGGTMPKDQCLFLNYYKLKYRTWLPRTIRAAAGPQYRGGGDLNDESGVEAILETESTLEKVYASTCLYEGNLLIPTS